MRKLRAHKLSAESDGPAKTLQAVCEENRPQSELGACSLGIHLVFSVASLVPNESNRYYKVLTHGHLSKRREGIESPLVARKEQDEADSDLESIRGLQEEDDADFVL